jgi:hypothetical protein
MPNVYRKVGENWEVQPHNDNYWLTFDDLIDAIKCGKGVNDDHFLKSL